MLVIIGLVVGGVLTGQELIQQAQMRSLMKEIEQFKTATETFYGKYQCLPGDCVNATAWFTADPACRSNGSRTYMAATNNMTCNGGGDGIIDDESVITYEAERHLCWQHLSLAGFIQGTFTGTCAYTGADCQTNANTWATNLNAPASPIGYGMISIVNPDSRFPQASYPNWFFIEGGGHVFWLGGSSGTDGSGNQTWNSWPAGALTPKQAYALDKKYDDGYPNSGQIHDGRPQNIAMMPGTGDNGCENTSLSPPSYDTNTANKNLVNCVLMFKAGF